MIEQTTADERDALRDLVNSPGWTLFERFCQEQYGDSACIAEIDRVLKDAPAGLQDALNDNVQRIRASANAVRFVLHWPRTRLQELTQPKADRGLFGRRRTSV